MKISTLLAPALCLALAGCDDLALSVVCPGEPQPSVVVNLLDGDGLPVSHPTTGWFTVGGTTDSLRQRNIGDGATRLAAFGPIGMYQLRVIPAGQAEVSLPNVRVDEGACGPATRFVDVQLAAMP
ncbi:MAG TPA: hypothetical protein VGX50_10820 [Longimicrobium sp.]|jgi:hypothetical protein|nr:hypothetical protein [Longimicrobium sp.]